MSPEGSPCGPVSNFRWESESPRQLVGKCAALSWPMSPVPGGTATSLLGMWAWLVPSWAVGGFSKGFRQVAHRA